MGTKHTKTPWLVASGSGRTIITDGRIPAVAETHGDDAEGNAAFIVRACNAHDDLVRIAELVLQAAANRNNKDWQLMHLDISEAAELSANALSKAGA